LKTVNLPKWVVVCMVLMTISMSAFAVSGAILQYTLIKPYVMNVAVVGSKLVVDSFILTYDPPINRYANCTVQVRSTSSTDLTGTVNVYLYNVAQVSIATGQYSGTFVAAGVRTLTIPLTWFLNANATDVASGRVVVQQT